LYKLSIPTVFFCFAPKVHHTLSLGHVLGRWTMALPKVIGSQATKLAAQIGWVK